MITQACYRDVVEAKSETNEIRKSYRSLLIVVWVDSFAVRSLNIEHAFLSESKSHGVELLNLVDR